MNRLDLIIDRLEHCKGLTQIDRMHLKKALAAARELKALAQSEPQVCCGDYEKCIKPCTPRGRWLAEKELTKSEQKPVAWRCTAPPCKCFDASYAKQCAYGYTAPPKREQELVCNKDPHLCGFVQCQLGKVCKNTIVGQFVGGIPEVSQQREWVGLTDDEIKKIMQRWRNGYIDIKDVEQLLKEKNT